MGRGPLNGALTIRRFLLTVRLTALPARKDDHRSSGQGGGHVDDTLVPAPPPGEGEGPLRQQEGAVHQHIQLRQQGPLGLGPRVPEALKGPAGVAPHVQPVGMGGFRQLQTVLRLGEGLSPREGQAVGEGIFQQLRKPGPSTMESCTRPKIRIFSRLL